ncbi:MAG TPA: hypothetical protein VFS45_04770 [Sphingomicrobium sp.]|nr:hypothetical protein [Sphingomicrobium sp.]
MSTDFAARALRVGGFLGFDQAMAPHGCEDLGDGRPGFGVGDGATRGRRDCSAARTHDLRPVDRQLGAAQLPDLLEAVAVHGLAAVAPDERSRLLANRLAGQLK